ncbi:MAG: (E)-4-hydroxy-3-methylbut-2-enyl-diphosphate synthase [Muribaculaceae bacterium]|nr:(E)-4-hydroxy-3-methylbut-2-enyl-diphosphate synthase [Muribaculaceae bacterium]
MSHFSCQRRRTVTVSVGNPAITIGSEAPVRIQSMASTPTLDTEASVTQGRSIIEAGAELLRYTAQGVMHARNLGEIRKRLRELGFVTPIVADIHFNPKAAFEAATQVDKVRINPGNFIDPGRVFRKIDYTDAEYEAELRRLDDALIPFLELCKSRSVAIRIGVNHGSLSDRIMSRYGDTPEGIVESALEFLRVCRRTGFSDVVVSVKASNVALMVSTVRLLVNRMDSEGLHFPLHLGVTEAGDGDDGRIKSAVGIGTLLSEGIGDTIRVSLSEAPEAELPVARALVDYIALKAQAPEVPGELLPGYDPIFPVTEQISPIGKDRFPIVVGADIPLHDLDMQRFRAEELWGELPASLQPGRIILLHTDHGNPSAAILAAIHNLRRRGALNPIIISASYTSLTPEEVTLRSSVDLGAIFLAGFGQGIHIEADCLTPDKATQLAFGILQATRRRITRTEYIACPGCGRTLFDLPGTLAAVKKATAHLTGLKIGVMGCIVNGPGEMADADYGYVGAGPGSISLYRGKQCVCKGIPQAEAVDRLVELIKADGLWK